MSEQLAGVAAGAPMIRRMRPVADAPVQPGDVLVCFWCRGLVGYPHVGAVLLAVQQPGERFTGSVPGFDVFLCHRCGAPHIFLP